MAPTLFNLNTYVVAEQWLDRVELVEGVGILVVSKQDGKLFHSSTSNACEILAYKSKFADDVVLLAPLREAVCVVIRAY